MALAQCPGQDKRFWTPDDIFEIKCGECGTYVEFFKDDGYRKCPKCDNSIQNPKVTLGCAQWCPHAVECLGYDPKQRAEERKTDVSIADRLIAAMKQEFGTDQKRIDHALKVLDFARAILAREQASPKVVIAAAILHDIGIQEAQRKHGSCAGKFQEIEGPPIAERIMRDNKIDPHTIIHVSRIVGNHHSVRDVDTPEFRIIWDADWLVNLPDEYPDAGKEKMRAMIDNIFKTQTGKDMALKLYA